MCNDYEQHVAWADYRRAMEKLGLKEAEVIRLATEIGLSALAQIKFDPATLIARFVLENQTQGTVHQLMNTDRSLQVAEEGAPYNDEAETAKALRALHEQDQAKARAAAGKSAPNPAARK